MSRILVRRGGGAGAGGTRGAVVLGRLLSRGFSGLVSRGLIRLRNRRRRCGGGRRIDRRKRRPGKEGGAHDPAEDHGRGDEGRKNEGIGLLHATSICAQPQNDLGIASEFRSVDAGRRARPTRSHYKVSTISA